MTSNLQYPKLSIRISKSGAVVIIRDELGGSILINTNLLKHVLGVPYKRKNGTYVSAEAIRLQQARVKTLRPIGPSKPARSGPSMNLTQTFEVPDWEEAGRVNRK